MPKYKTSRKSRKYQRDYYYTHNYIKDTNDNDRRVYFTGRDLERMISAARIDPVNEFPKGGAV